MFDSFVSSLTYEHWILVLMVVIIVLLMMNYYKKNEMFEHMTSSENIEAIDNLASMYQNGSLKVKDLQVTGSATIKDSLNVPNITMGADAKGSKSELKMYGPTIQLTTVDGDAGCGTTFTTANNGGINAKAACTGQNGLLMASNQFGNYVKYGDKLGIQDKNDGRLFVTTTTGDGGNFVPYFSNGKLPSDACSKGDTRSCMSLTKLT
jgi:hypothetical protein